MGNSNSKYLIKAFVKLRASFLNFEFLKHDVGLLIGKAMQLIFSINTVILIGERAKRARHYQV